MLHQGVPTCFFHLGSGEWAGIQPCQSLLSHPGQVAYPSWAPVSQSGILPLQATQFLTLNKIWIYWLPHLTVWGAWLQVQPDPGSKGSARSLHSVFRAVCPPSGSRVPLSREQVQAPPLHSRCPGEVKEPHPRIPSIPGPEVLPWHSQHRVFILHGACEWEVKGADQS